jgi:NodT family efflux transporter outer membrane factor (OMF) lipoprotein
LNARAASLLALVAAACLAGCTVGPDFRSPDPPAADRYVPGPTPDAAGMPRLVDQRDIPAEWWGVFRSPAIDALVRRALAGSPTLDEARARLLQAQELREARAGATTYPKVDASFGAERQRIDPATFGFPNAPNPGPFNVFSLGANVAYNFDLVGGSRRELEALAAEVDYQSYEFEAARLTLASNVVTAALRRAALAAQVESATAILVTQRRQLAIVEARYADGGVSLLDLHNQRVLVAQSEALLAPLTAQVAQAGHLLAVLLGESPATADLPALRLADVAMPPELPVRVPSELVRQRPDIRASEALLHKASANVGMATADLYPKLVISGGFSSSQLNIGDVLGNGINIWNIGANLLQPVFRGGELQARKRAAEAAFDQAAAAYRKSVLLGLQNVADVLRALEADANTLAARTEQSGRAEDAYRIAAGRFELGGVSQQVVLDADRQRLSAELDRVQALANQYTDAVALFQALGGGWVADAPPTSGTK